MSGPRKRSYQWLSKIRVSLLPVDVNYAEKSRFVALGHVLPANCTQLPYLIRDLAQCLLFTNWSQCLLTNTFQYSCGHFEVKVAYETYFVANGPMCMGIPSPWWGLSMMAQTYISQREVYSRQKSIESLFLLFNSKLEHSFIQETLTILYVFILKVFCSGLALKAVTRP